MGAITIPKQFVKRQAAITYETQADRVIRRFGGVGRLTRALKFICKDKTRLAIQKWRWPRHKGGSGGIIPGCAIMDVIEAARVAGLVLTPEDLDPRPTDITGGTGRDHIV